MKIWTLFAVFLLVVPMAIAEPPFPDDVAPSDYKDYLLGEEGADLFARDLAPAERGVIIRELVKLSPGEREQFLAMTNDAHKDKVRALVADPSFDLKDPKMREFAIQVMKRTGVASDEAGEKFISALTSFAGNPGIKYFANPAIAPPDVEQEGEDVYLVGGDPMTRVKLGPMDGKIGLEYSVDYRGKGVFIFKQPDPADPAKTNQLALPAGATITPAALGTLDIQFNDGSGVVHKVDPFIAEYFDKAGNDIEIRTEKGTFIVPPGSQISATVYSQGVTITKNLATPDPYNVYFRGDDKDTFTTLTLGTGIDDKPAVLRAAFYEPELKDGKKEGTDGVLFYGDLLSATTPTPFGGAKVTPVGDNPRVALFLGTGPIPRDGNTPTLAVIEGSDRPLVSMGKAAVSVELGEKVLRQVGSHDGTTFELGIKDGVPDFLFSSYDRASGIRADAENDLVEFKDKLRKMGIETGAQSTEELDKAISAKEKQAKDAYKAAEKSFKEADKALAKAEKSGKATGEMRAAADKAKSDLEKASNTYSSYKGARETLKSMPSFSTAPDGSLDVEVSKAKNIVFDLGRVEISGEDGNSKFVQFMAVGKDAADLGYADSIKVIGGAMGPGDDQDKFNIQVGDKKISYDSDGEGNAKFYYERRSGDEIERNSLPLVQLVVEPQFADGAVAGVTWTVKDPKQITAALASLGPGVPQLHADIAKSLTKGGPITIASMSTSKSGVSMSVNLPELMAAFPGAMSGELRDNARAYLPELIGGAASLVGDMPPGVSDIIDFVSKGNMPDSLIDAMTSGPGGFSTIRLDIPSIDVDQDALKKVVDGASGLSGSLEKLQNLKLAKDPRFYKKIISQAEDETMRKIDAYLDSVDFKEVLPIGAVLSVGDKSNFIRAESISGQVAQSLKEGVRAQLQDAVKAVPTLSSIAVAGNVPSLLEIAIQETKRQLREQLSERIRTEALKAALPGRSVADD